MVSACDKYSIILRLLDAAVDRVYLQTCWLSKATLLLYRGVHFRHADFLPTSHNLLFVKAYLDFFSPDLINLTVTDTI